MYFVLLVQIVMLVFVEFLSSELMPSARKGFIVVGTFIGAWYILYGVVAGVIQEKIWMPLLYFGGIRARLERKWAWFGGLLWIVFGLWCVYTLDLFPPVTRFLSEVFGTFRPGDVFRDLYQRGSSLKVPV